MKNIDDSKSLKDLNLPGTHDSSTRFCSFSLFSSCQNLSVSEQLEIGVRVLDIRVGGKTAVHSFCVCKKSRFGKPLAVSDVIGDVYGFLDSNPTETVMLLYKMDRGKSSADCFNFLYDDFIKLNPEKWYLENRIPLLGEARGKIVLVRRTDSLLGDVGVDFTSMPDQGGTKESSCGEFFPNLSDSVTVQDRYGLLRSKKWCKAVKPLLDGGEKYAGSFVLNYLSTAGFPVIPRFNAKKINEKFSNYSLKAGGKYGTLMFDFVTPEISKKVINSNFTL